MRSWQTALPAIYYSGKNESRHWKHTAIIYKILWFNLPSPEFFSSPFFIRASQTLVPTLSRSSVADCLFFILLLRISCHRSIFSWNNILRRLWLMSTKFQFLCLKHWSAHTSLSKLLHGWIQNGGLTGNNFRFFEIHGGQINLEGYSFCL